jgi:serine-type D-Ala-D-Ala carboxypeptidase/endopeptidase (penicillin-binding protein 4)
MFKWARVLTLLLAFNSVAQGVPSPVAEGLRAAGIPLEAASIVVQRVGAGPGADIVLSHQPDAPMNPASVMKLPTTLAALELLGPAYTFKTQISLKGTLVNGKLEGDVHVRAGGDPKLNHERLWLMMRALRDRGLRSIHGDIVIDRGVFALSAFDPAKFDGEPLKAHNVGPDAFLVNLKAVRFIFVPREERVHIHAEPALPGLRIENEVRLTTGGCGDWRERMTRSIEAKGESVRVTFRGGYPLACGEGAWNMSLLTPEGYTAQALRGMWTDVGGLHKGEIRSGAVPGDAQWFMTMQSPPLAEIVRDVNKYSNNVMARQLFLALSMEQPGKASIEASERVMRTWLTAKGIEAPEFVVENGSGLSRKERMSARTTVQILQAAWRSPVLGDFLASLPLMGSDGTMRKRAATDGALGYAHIKGGTINGVRSIAGYVLDRQGQRWAVAFHVNHPNAANLQAVQDALLQWVYSGRPG